MKCKIQWIDPNTNNFTPDEFEAVAIAVSTITWGSAKQVKKYPICQHHLDRMKYFSPIRENDYYSEWTVEKLEEEPKP